MKRLIVAFVLVVGVGVLGLYFTGFFDKGEVSEDDKAAADDVAEKLLNDEPSSETFEVVPEEIDSTLEEAADEFDNFEEDFDPEAEL